MSVLEPVNNFTAFFEAAYSDKLQIFNELFGLFPFRFPDVDFEAGSAFDNKFFERLTEIYEEEKRIGHHLYIQQVDFSGESFALNVVPNSTKERMLFNDFLLSHYLDKHMAADKLYLVNRELTPLTLQQVNARIVRIENLLDLISSELRSQNRLIKRRFLQILSHGIDATSQNLRQSGSLRKKHVELYLFTLGYALSRYFESLHKLRIKINNTVAPKPLTVLQKISLMKDLGILEFLKNKMMEEKQSDVQHKFYQTLSLITSGLDINHTHLQDQLQRIYENVSRSRNGNNTD